MDPNALSPEIQQAMQRRGLTNGGAPGGSPQPAPAQAPQPAPPAQPVATPQSMAMGLPMGSPEAQLIEEALADRLKSISKQEEAKIAPQQPAQPMAPQGGF